MKCDKCGNEMQERQPGTWFCKQCLRVKKPSAAVKQHYTYPLAEDPKKHRKQ